MTKISGKIQHIDIGTGSWFLITDSGQKIKLRGNRSRLLELSSAQQQTVTVSGQFSTVDEVSADMLKEDQVFYID